MTKSLKGLVSFLVGVILLSFLVLPTYASTNIAGFTVNPIIPENQQGDTGSYFDLRVKPNTSQTIQLMVTNTTNEEILIDIEAVSASTSSAGGVNYTVENDRDESLKNPFVEIAEITEKLVSIPAGGSKAIDIDLKMPTESFDGIILGSICVTNITDRVKENSAESSEEFSVEIKNEYEYVTAVVLQENDKLVEANFELGRVSAVIDNDRQAIVAEIRNTSPRLIKELKYNGSITSQSSGVALYKLDDTEVSFAPNSVMAYKFRDSEVRNIPPGKYIFTGSITEGDKVWDFSQEFTVEDIDAVEAKTFFTQQIQSVFKGNTTVMIVAGVVGILVVALIILMVMRAREKRL